MNACSIRLRFGPLVTLAGVALALLFSGCATTPRTPSTEVLTQVSAIDALLAGGYDGQTSLAALRRSGDFGIGTFHALDGEMILLDGAFYQAKADGHIYQPALTDTTPFASVVHFQAQKTTTITGEMDWAKLTATADMLAGDANALCAIRVHGTFRQVKVRSVPGQQKPYPPLAEVAKTQPVFELSNVTGTLVGFRAPPFVKGLNVPGYHLHFLSDDHQSGGHVLSLTLESGTLELASYTLFQVQLPAAPGTLAGLDLHKDRAQELKAVEQ